MQQQQQPNGVPSTQRLLITLVAEHINSRYPKLASERMRDAQRQVAEIVQLLHVSQLLHRRLLDLDREHEYHESEDPEVQTVESDADFEPAGVDKKSSNVLHQGNKLAVLGGDLLFTLAIRLMADLRNQIITESVTHTVHEQARASFSLQSGTMTTEALAADPPLGFRIWARLQLQLSITNLQNGCRSLIALLPEDAPDRQFVSSNVIQFARHFGYALHTALERHRVLLSFPDLAARLPLLSAPVLLDGRHLHRLVQPEKLVSATISVRKLMEHFPDHKLSRSQQLIRTRTRQASDCLQSISTCCTPLHDLLEAVDRF